MGRNQRERGMEERVLIQLLNDCKQMADMTDLQSLLAFALTSTRTAVNAASAKIMLTAENCLPDTGLGYEAQAGFYPLQEVPAIPALDGVAVNGGQLDALLQYGPKKLGWMHLHKGNASFLPEEIEMARLYAGAVSIHVHRCLITANVQSQLDRLDAELNQERLDRRLSESALAKRAEQIETIYKIGLAITSGLDLKEVIWELYRQCKQVVKVDVFYVALYNALNDQLNFPLFLDCEVEVMIAPRSVKVTPSLTGYIIQSRKTFYSPDTLSPDADLPVKLILRHGGLSTRSFLGLPLIWREQIIGILSVQSYEINAYSPEDIQLMETIATQAAGALEHAQLYTQLNAAWSAAEKANADLKKALNKMERLAVTDKLTGTYNRRKFDEIIEQETSRAARYHSPLSILMLDIDHFKEFNDQHGHHIGDQVLQTFVRIIKAHLRSTDSMTRWGGDEFIILSPGIDLQKATLLAEKLRTLVEQHRFFSRRDLNVSISVGVTEYHRGESVDDLVRRADQALYQAKANGRNCVIESE